MQITNKWNYILEKYKINDAEYYEEYAKLYSDNVNMYYIEENNKIIFLILQISEKFNDFETPYGYGSFYTNNYDKKFIDSFFEILKKELNKINIIAGIIRYNPLYSPPNTKYVDNEFIRKIVYIDDLDSYTKYQSKTCKYMIRRAKKENYNIYISNNIEDYLSFGNIYRDLLIKKSANMKLIFSNNYFNKLYNSDISYLIVVRKNNILIGGSIFIIKSHSISYYHLSAFSKNYPGLSNLVLDFGIQHARELFSNKIILGGGMSNNAEDTLLKFKMSFSQKLLDFYLGKFIVNKDKYFDLINNYDNENKKYNNYFLRYRYAK